MLERSFGNGQRHVTMGLRRSGQDPRLMPDQVLLSCVKPFAANHCFAEGGFLFP